MKFEATRERQDDGRASHARLIVCPGQNFFPVPEDGGVPHEALERCVDIWGAEGGARFAPDAVVGDERGIPGLGEGRGRVT